MASPRHTFTNEDIDTLKTSGGDVDDPQDWADLTDNDNVTAEVSPVLEGYAGVFDKTLTLSGATNNATYARVFRSATGAGGPSGSFPGIPKYDGTILSFVETSGVTIFDILEAYSQIQDIVAKTNANSANSAWVFSCQVLTAGYVGCMTSDSINAGAGETGGVLCNGGGFFVDMLSKNNDQGNGFWNNSGDGYFYNCVGAENTDVNFKCVGGTMNDKNCLGVGGGNFDYLQVGGTLNRTTCGSGDATGTVGLQALSPNFIDPDRDDYHLPYDDQNLSGTDLSADATYPFDQDIDGGTITGTWPLGFHQFGSLGTEAAPIENFPADWGITTPDTGVLKYSSPNRVNAVDMQRQTAAFNEKAYTVSGGFSHSFKWHVEDYDGVPATSFAYPWMIGDRDEAPDDIIVANGSYLAIYIGGGANQIILDLFENGTEYGAPAVTPPSATFDFWVDVIHSAAAGAAGKGQTTVNFYSDSAKQVLYATRTLDQVAITVNSFASNVFAVSSWGGGGNTESVTMYVEDLNLAVPPPTPSDRPTTFQEGLKDISRTPQFKVIPTFDICSLVFGNAPCTATGVECYNTRSTCKDPQNYTLSTRDLSFTMSNSPVPFLQGERPYVRSIDFLPTEIKTDLTVKGRVNIVMEDEPDSDATEDPYFTSRATVNKTGYYWRRLIARNPFYIGRPIKIFEGFLGLDSDQFELRWEGRIDDISFNPDGSVNIQAVDILQDLAKIEVPAKLDLSLLVNMTAASTVSLTLNTVTALDSTGFVRVDDEIIAYAAKDDLTGILSGLTRGSFNTSPATHSEETKVQNTRHYGPANPFDIMSSAMLLVDAGITATSIESTAFSAEKALIPIEVNYEALVVEPIRLDRLYFEEAEHLGVNSWQNENQRITVKRYTPNQPARSYSSVSEEGHIIEASQSISLQSTQRISRTSMYWEYDNIGDFEDPVSYNRINVVIDLDAESSQEYDQISERKIFSRWVRLGNDASSAVERYANNVPARLLSRNRDPRELLNVTLELKDSTIATGENVKVTTEKLVDIFGNGLDKSPFQVVKRDKMENDINITTQRHKQRRMGWIASTAITTAYGDASTSEREYGFIASATSLLLDNTDQAYRIF